MRAELKDFFSTDVEPDPEKPGYLVGLDKWKPVDDTDFGILIQAQIGSAGEEVADTFQFVVCTATWLEGWLRKELWQQEYRGVSPARTWGRGYLVVSGWDYKAVHEMLLDLCKRSYGPDWDSVTRKLSRFMHWEFEDTEYDK
jgi:hypothetical protein